MSLSASFARRSVPFALAYGACLSIVLGVTGLAGAAVHSEWVTSTHSQSRLIGGTVEIDGKPTLLAGVQMRMDPGWKTYWKHPGDSGVPPGFDWSGSKNLKSAELLYPVPHRFADAGGTAIGYGQEVVFPVKITPERAGEPIDLQLTFDYGLCKDLCIPNEVTLSLTLPAEGAQETEETLLLANALAHVPKSSDPNEVPRVVTIDAKLDGPEPRLEIEALFDPKAAKTDLFIEAGDVFVPVPKPLSPPADGKQRFEVSFGSTEEAQALKGKTLSLTLVSDKGSAETVWKAE